MSQRKSISKATMAESKKTVAAEIQDKPTAPAETLSELDKLVVAFIDGALDVNEINNLDIFNRWLVLSMSAIYSCAKIGLLSAKACVKAKYKLLQEYRRFRTNTFFAEKEHIEWIKRTRETSCKLTELSKAIAEHDPEVLSIALQIIDLLTKQDIYNELFILSDASDTYKADCLKTLTENDTAFLDEFGNIPFVDLLFKFYKSTEETRASEIFKELDADNIRKVACHVPVKSDDCRGIAKSYKECFDI